MRNIESRVTTGPSNALLASPRSAHFSPRILQVGAVKGLTIMINCELNCSIARSLLPRAVGGGGGALYCTFKCNIARDNYLHNLVMGFKEFKGTSLSKMHFVPTKPLQNAFCPRNAARLQHGSR